MKKLIGLLLISTSLFAQQYPYDISESLPFGKLNEAAPIELLDFGQLVGQYNCKSSTRNASQEWNAEEDIIWRWKYIMNGLAVQDETLKPDGSHSGSIRVFDTDSLTWRVHYYANVKPAPNLSAWTGGKTESGDIVLFKDQKAPNGTEGYYRITFKDITKNGYDWLGEWVNKDQSFAYPTWKISCKRDL